MPKEIKQAVPSSPPASSEGRRALMRAIKRRDTKPEWQIRRLLHGEGRRYRVDFPIRTDIGLVRPDIAFTRARLAVFIDGCYWHSCPEHGRVPQVNADYWKPKLARNVERDHATAAALEACGWSVLRFWEHEDPALVAQEVASVFRAESGDPASRRPR